MLTTHGEDKGAAVEITQYSVLATAEILGWKIQLCEWKGAPFLLYRPKEWKGRQPRFAATSTGVDDFTGLLRDLKRVGVCKERIEVTLVTEPAIRIVGGVSTVPNRLARQLWAELTSYNTL